MRKENFIQQFCLLRVSLRCAFTRVPQHMCCAADAGADIEPGCAAPLQAEECTRMRCDTLVNKFEQCSYYPSGPITCQLCCGLCRARKLSGLYLNFCSKDERISYRFGTT